MRKKLPFWMTLAVVLGVWLLANWVAQTHVEARESVGWAPAAQAQRPLQQSCPDAPDLVIQRIVLDPDAPGAGGPYNVHVGIANNGIAAGTVDTWANLYVDRPPTGDPNLQAFASTGGLASGSVITTHFTVPGEYATVGFHSLSILIDALDQIAESTTCNGEANNATTTAQFEIQGVATPTPTPTIPPSIAPPQIYSFTPSEATIARGQTVELRWQVYGEAVSVYLDGELVPIEDRRTVQPYESHVYTLRAENPGGFVERISRVTVVDPSATPTLTPTPCKLATIHQFGATDTSIPRGGSTTLYWDLSGATEAYLDGEGVVGVSEREVTLQQTTIFTLRAHNACGDVEKSLTITVYYATPTRTPTPSRTATPTRTPTSTATPTRRVLPTPTYPPGTGTPSATPDLNTPPPTDQPFNTITPNVTSTSSTFDSPLGTPSAFDSPLGTPSPTIAFTPTYTATAIQTTVVTPTSTTMPSPASTSMPSPASTSTGTPTQTAQPTPTPAPNTAEPEATAVAQSAADLATASATASPSPSPTAASTPNTIRMYLCPLGILVVFAVGVLGLSIVLPRIQERKQEQESYTMAAGGVGLDQEGQVPSLFGESATRDTARNEDRGSTGKDGAPGGKTG